MDIFLPLLKGLDLLTSFFTNFCNLRYADFVSFLTGDYVLNFHTFFYNTPMSIVMPSIDIIGLDWVFDRILEIVSLIFYPISYLTDHVPSTPFYLCFLSFIINCLLLLGIIKLISFLIELIPGE